MHCGAALEAVAMPPAETSPLTEPVDWSPPPWMTPAEADPALTAEPSDDAGDREVWGSADITASGEAVANAKRKREMPPAMIIGGLALAAALLLYTVLSVTVLAHKSQPVASEAAACASFKEMRTHHANAELSFWYGPSAPVFQKAAASNPRFAKAADEVTYLAALYKDATRATSIAQADIDKHLVAVDAACA